MILTVIANITINNIYKENEEQYGELIEETNFDAGKLIELPKEEKNPYPNSATSTLPEITAIDLYGMNFDTEEVVYALYRDMQERKCFEAGGYTKIFFSMVSKPYVYCKVEDVSGKSEEYKWNYNTHKFEKIESL